MLIMPLVVVITEALRSGIEVYKKAVFDTYTIKALLLTLEATLAAVAVNTVFGLFAAWTVTKYQFRKKKLLTTLIDIPFAISPIIAGLIFILTFGRIGWTHGILTALDIKIVFAVPGVILGTVFVTFPFISREIIPVLNAQGSDYGSRSLSYLSQDYLSPDQMGISIWSCIVYCPGNGGIRSSICPLGTFKGQDDNLTPAG